jgi:hypothetical protein
VVWLFDEWSSLLLRLLKKARKRGRPGWKKNREDRRTDGQIDRVLRTHPTIHASSCTYVQAFYYLMRVFKSNKNKTVEQRKKESTSQISFHQKRKIIEKFNENSFLKHLMQQIVDQSVVNGCATDCVVHIVCVASFVNIMFCFFIWESLNQICWKCLNLTKVCLSEKSFDNNDTLK